MAEWKIYEADTPQCTSCGVNKNDKIAKEKFQLKRKRVF